MGEGIRVLETCMTYRDRAVITQQIASVLGSVRHILNPTVRVK